MTVSQDRFTAVKARLTTALPTFDGTVDLLTIAERDYFVLSDSSLASPARYVSAPVDVEFTVTTVCVARSADDCRRAADLCRSRLTDWSPDPGRADPFREVDSGPVLRAVAGGDVRYSITLTHQTITGAS